MVGPAQWIVVLRGFMSNETSDTLSKDLKVGDRSLKTNCTRFCRDRSIRQVSGNVFLRDSRDLCCKCNTAQD